MEECNTCGRNCVNGTLTAGIYSRCTEKQKQSQKRADEIMRIMNNPFWQMEMETGQC